jgi:hypothetical protein
MERNKRLLSGRTLVNYRRRIALLSRGSKGARAGRPVLAKEKTGWLPVFLKVERLVDVELFLMQCGIAFHDYRPLG